VKRIYCDIQKSEEQADGTIIVSGIASAPTKDADGETVTTEAMSAALPDYMRFGAVREMHQAKAAGTALEAFIMENGATSFTAHVVDSEAVKKVKNKVYKGFSIGGKVLERDATDPNIITAIKLIEVSLVDRPNNPDSVFTMYKADGIEEDHSPTELDAIKQLSALVNKGAIVPSKLVELAQSFITKGVANMTLQKSLWDVAELASLLGQLKSVQSCLAFDAAYEGEMSPASMQLKTNIADLATTLIALIGEEIPEATAAAEGEGGVADQTVTEAEGAEDVTEAAGEPKAKDSGDPEGDPVVDKDDDGGDMAEAEDPNDGNLTQPKKAKKAAPIGDLSKMSGNDLAKVIGASVTAALAPVVTRLNKLEAQPAPSKAVLKVVGKTDDVTKVEAEQSDEPPAGASPEQIAQFEIRKLHRTGGLL
jgi:hypothetical protein